MKTIVRPLLSIALLASLSFNTFGEIAKLPSLEWQVQDLENNLTKKIETSLNSILTPKQYAVNVEIIASQPKEPEFNKTNENEEEARAASTDWSKELEKLVAKNKETDKKLEESVAQAEAKAREKKVEEEKRVAESEKKKVGAKVKFNDAKPDDAKFGDNVVMSKFGIEAPLVEDYNDLSPDGKIILTMNSSESKNNEEETRLKRLLEEKEKELAQIDREMQKNERAFSFKEAALVNKIRMTEAAADKKKNEASPIEQIWKYNNSIDVFKNLKEVNIKVRLSQGLDEELKQKVESHVRGMKFNLGRVVPKIKFEYGLLGSDISGPSKTEMLKDWLNVLGKYSTLIGLVLAVVLFGIVGSRLIQKYFELNTGTQNSSTIKMENKGGEKSSDSGDKSMAQAMFGGEGTGPSAVTGLNGVERFKYYMKSAPNDAVLLVKKWISSGEPGSKEALKAIVQQMENDDLALIFSKLSSSQKVYWRELLNQPLPDSELHKANTYISGQIIQNVIVPSAVTDPSTYDLILKLTPDNVVILVKNEPKTAAMLLNILSGSFVNEVLSKCSKTDRDYIIGESINVSQDDIIRGQVTLKQTLQKIVEHKEPKPFLDKLMGLVHTATPEIEDSLHHALGKNFSKDQLKKIAMEKFPAALISELPVGLIKNILQAYPREKRVRLLYSLDQEMKNFYTNIIAPQGSKASEMFNLEFEKIEKDAAEVEKISQEAQELWFDFVTFARGEIRNDTSFARDVSELIDAWAEDLAETRSGGRLKIVA